MYITAGGTKSKFLNKQSPAFLGKKMNIPILLAHDTADIRVPSEHSRRMEKALKKYRKSHSILWLKDGYHFVLQVQHRKNCFRHLWVFRKIYRPLKSLIVYFLSEEESSGFVDLWKIKAEAQDLAGLCPFKFVGRVSLNRF